MRGKQGQFRCTGLPPGPVRLDVRSNDYTAGRHMKAEAQAGDEDLRLVLSPQGLIAFLVTDEATGLAPQTKMLRISEVPDDGAKVWLLNWRSMLRKPRAAKRAEWRIAELGKTYRFRVEARSYAPIEVLSVTVPKTGGKQIVPVSLRPAPDYGASLTIRLRMAEGELPEVIAVTWDARGECGVGEPTKVEDERVVLKLLPGPQHIVLGRWESPDPAEKTTFTLPHDLELDLRRGEEREVEATLRLGGWPEIHGEPDVEPVEGPENIRLIQGERVLTCQAVPHARGEDSFYRLRVLPPGTWTLEYTGDLDGRKVGRRAAFEVRPGEITRIDAKKLKTFKVDDK